MVQEIMVPHLMTFNNCSAFKDALILESGISQALRSHKQEFMVIKLKTGEVASTFEELFY